MTRQQRCQFVEHPARLDDILVLDQAADGDEEGLDAYLIRSCQCSLDVGRHRVDEEVPHVMDFGLAKRDAGEFDPSGRNIFSKRSKPRRAYNSPHDPMPSVWQSGSK